MYCAMHRPKQSLEKATIWTQCSSGSTACLWYSSYIRLICYTHGEIFLMTFWCGDHISYLLDVGHLATSTVQFEVVCEDAFEALYIVKLYSPPSIASWTKPLHSIMVYSAHVCMHRAVFLPGRNESIVKPHTILLSRSTGTPELSGSTAGHRNPSTVPSYRQPGRE